MCLDVVLAFGWRHCRYRHGMGGVFFLFLLPKPGFSFEILFVFILLSGEGKERKGEGVPLLCCIF